MSLRKFVILLAFAMILELGVFNFSNVILLMNPNIEKNKIYMLTQMETHNWIKSNGNLISEPDPNIILPNLNTDIKTVKLQAQLDRPVPYIVLFYTDSNNKNFSEKTMKVYKGNFKDTVVLPLDVYVKDLRIDLGDDPGVNLKGLNVIINPVKLDFSISRVIAIILIYISAIGLFALQRNPDYHLDKKPTK